jgi:hypothetical protein
VIQGAEFDGHHQFVVGTGFGLGDDEVDSATGTLDPVAAEGLVASDVLIAVGTGKFEIAHGLIRWLD